LLGSNNKDSFDSFSMVSSQAWLVGGGPPTRNIEFDLRRNTKQPPPFGMQQDTNNATAMDKEGNGMPIGGPPAVFTPGGAGANANTANPMPQPRQGGAAAATTTNIMPYSGFDEVIKSGDWVQREPSCGTSSGRRRWMETRKKITSSRRLLAAYKIFKLTSS
jgi:hypothetical protein